MGCKSTTGSSLAVCVAALLFACFCPAETESAVRLREALDSVIIPEMDFRAANIFDVISFLQECSSEFDRRNVPHGEKGLNIVLNVTHYDADTHHGIPLITFAAKDISLKEALRIVTQVAGLEYSFESNWINVHPPAERGYALPVFRKVTPADASVEEQLKTIIIPDIDWRQAPLAACLDAVNKQIVEQGKGTAKSTKVLLGFQQSDRSNLLAVTLRARRISVYDAVRIAAGATLTDCQVVDDNVRLRLRKIERKRPKIVAARNARELTFDTFPNLCVTRSVQSLQVVVLCRLMGADFAWQKPGEAGSTSTP